MARAHPGVGKVSALFGEDLSYAFRELVTGHFRYASTRLGGILEGFRK